MLRLNDGAVLLLKRLMANIGENLSYLRVDFLPVRPRILVSTGSR
jgi:hypothetical protein